MALWEPRVQIPSSPNLSIIPLQNKKLPFYDAGAFIILIQNQKTSILFILTNNNKCYNIIEMF